MNRGMAMAKPLQRIPSVDQDSLETRKELETMFGVAPVAMNNAVRDLLLFVYNVNELTQQLLKKAEVVYAQRTIHSGIGNDSPANPLGDIGK